MGVKGKNNINSDNYGILLNGDRTQWLVKRGDTEVRTIDIEASRAVEDNPLFYHNVYTREIRRLGIWFIIILLPDRMDIRIVPMMRK